MITSESQLRRTKETSCVILKRKHEEKKARKEEKVSTVWRQEGSFVQEARSSRRLALGKNIKSMHARRGVSWNPGINKGDGVCTCTVRDEKKKKKGYGTFWGFSFGR